MALDSRTKTMIVASITAAAMVVTSLVIWKQVFFGKRAAPETVAVTQRPEQADSGALPPQAGAPGQLSAPSGGAILAPVSPRQTPEPAPAAKNGEKTLDQIFSERQPIASQAPAPQNAAPPPEAQGASQSPVAPVAPVASPPPSGQDVAARPGQRPQAPAPANAPSPAEPAQAEPQYRPVETDSTAAAKPELAAEPAQDDPERAALESSLEKEALGLTKISKVKGKEKKTEPEAKGKKQPSPEAVSAAAPETQAPAAKTEPQATAQAQAGAAKAEPPTKAERQTKAAPGSAWKGQGVFQAASVSASGDATTVHIKATAVPPTPVVVTADSPARVIIDLPGRWEHEGPGEVSGAGVVRKVRIGKHSDKLRIVLDLTVDSTSKLAGKPVIEQTGAGLTITVRK